MILIEPDRGPPIAGLAIRAELYRVLASPPLAGMRFPRPDFPWPALRAAGFHEVVALHPGRYEPAPLILRFAEPLEDLFGGAPPSDPAREQERIRRAVAATLQALESGHGVVVHCLGGRGRTGTVLGAVLRELGLPATAVIDYLDRVHRARGKPGWPESPWQRTLLARWEPIPPGPRPTGC